MIDFLQEAMKYASVGLAVFPCAEGAKVPAIKGGHGCKDASVDPNVIKAWAKEYPRANIGFACGKMSGNIVAVDVDPRHGGDKSIAMLALKGRTFPAGPVSKSGNGGNHLFFRYDGKLANSKGQLGDGLDIRGDGGYVIAPPSFINASEDGPGGAYQWVASIFDTPIPRLPIWIAELLRPKMPKPYTAPKTFAEGAERIDHLARFAAKAAPGSRNNSSFWAACRAAELAADGKVNRARAIEQLTIAGQMAGLSRDEIEKTIASAFGRIEK